MEHIVTIIQNMSSAIEISLNGSKLFKSKEKEFLGSVKVILK